MKTERPKQSVKKPVVVAVEGLDYFYFLLGQIESTKFDDVQLWIFDQGQTFSGQVSLIMNDRRFKEGGVRALGFIRDAESNRAASDDSIRNALHDLGLPVPTEPKTIAVGALKTGYLLMPNGENSGCLEHACLKASLFPNRLVCAEAFLDCVSKTYTKPTNENRQAKVKVHALIASDEGNPAMTLGRSASANLWDFSHPSLKVMLEFIEMMAKT
jgi:hypothetical protein